MAYKAFIDGAAAFEWLGAFIDVFQVLAWMVSRLGVRLILRL
jgi:hypothetical protein